MPVEYVGSCIFVTAKVGIELQGQLKRIENQIHPQSREECDEKRAKASDKPDYGARIVNGVQVSYHDGDIVAVYEDTSNFSGCTVGFSRKLFQTFI